MTDVQSTLAERGKTHGNFTDHAVVCQSLKRVMQASPNWATLTDVNKEALEMIVHKIARVLCGDPTHGDNFHDIAGYSVLAERECQ